MDVTFTGDRSQISIEEGVEIDPLVVFDSRKGPIVVRRHSHQLLYQD
jgi:hypothetical protein